MEPEISDKNKDMEEVIVGIPITGLLMFLLQFSEITTKHLFAKYKISLDLLKVFCNVI